MVGFGSGIPDRPCGVCGNLISSHLESVAVYDACRDVFKRNERNARLMGLGIISLAVLMVIIIIALRVWA